MWRANSLEKTLMLRKTEGRRRGGPQRMRQLDGITDSIDMSLSKLWDYEGQGSLVCCTPWGCKESDMTEWLNHNKSNYYLVHLCGGLWVRAVWLVRSLFPDQRLNPVSQQWKLRVLTVGQPGNSHCISETYMVLYVNYISTKLEENKAYDYLNSCYPSAFSMGWLNSLIH